MESSPRPFLTSLVITPMRVITKPAAAMTAIWPTALNEATVRAKISTWTILANVANGTVMAHYIRVAELKWLQFDSGRIGSISCMWHCPAAYSALMTSLTRTPACLLAVRKLPLLLWQTLVPALWRLGLPFPIIPNSARRPFILLAWPADSPSPVLECQIPKDTHRRRPPNVAIICNSRMELRPQLLGKVTPISSPIVNAVRNVKNQKTTIPNVQNTMRTQITPMVSTMENY